MPTVNYISLKVIHAMQEKAAEKYQPYDPAKLLDKYWILPLTLIPLKIISMYFTGLCCYYHRITFSSPDQLRLIISVGSGLPGDRNSLDDYYKQKASKLTGEPILVPHKGGWDTYTKPHRPGRRPDFTKVVCRKDDSAPAEMVTFVADILEDLQSERIEQKDKHLSLYKMGYNYLRFSTSRAEKLALAKGSALEVKVKLESNLSLILRSV